MLRWLSSMLIFLGVFSAHSPVFAETRCETKPIAGRDFRKALTLGHKLYEHLENSGAQAALLGRIGSDVSDQGLRYTHMGMAYKQAENGRWTIVHLLNQCGSDESDIYQEGLINFFLDSPFEYEVLVVQPTPSVQQAILKIAQSDRVRVLHEPAYNIISNPKRSDFQNCNQWLLEMLVAGIESNEKLVSRDEIHRQDLYASFQPDVIHIPYTKRIAGGIVSKNLVFTDHSVAARLSGRYEVTTVRSIVRWLEQKNWVQQKRVITL